MKSAFLPILASILMGTNALAQDNRVLNFNEAKQMADQGNAYGEAVVAFHYSVGWQTEKNLELAAKYATSSARKGHPLGIFRLGVLSRAGEGIERNEDQGLALQKKAFAGLNKMQGNPYAITALGEMLTEGKVLPENKKDAVRLFKVAADSGFAPAQFNYARCAQDGQWNPKSESVKNQYLMLAFEKGYPLAICTLNTKAWGPENEQFEPKGIQVEKNSKLVVFDLAKMVGSAVQNMDAEKLQPIVQQHPHKVCWVNFSDDLKKVVIVSSNELFLYEVPTGRLLKTKLLSIPEAVVGDSVLKNENRFLRAFFAKDSNKVWATLGSVHSEQSDVLLEWNINDNSLKEFEIQAGKGSIIGYDSNTDTLAILSEGNEHLLFIRANDKKLVGSYVMPELSYSQIHEAETFAAYFNRTGDCMIARWSYYEEVFMGLESLIFISNGNLSLVPWITLANGSRNGHGDEAVSSKSFKLLIDFIGIPSSFATVKDLEVAINLNGREFDLGKSISLGGGVGKLINNNPYFNWALFLDNNSIVEGKIAEPAATFADGVSSSSDGSKIIFWGIDNQFKMFDLDGKIQQETGANFWIFSRSAPVTSFDLSILDGRAYSAKAGNHIWNAVISPCGENFFVAASNLKASNKNNKQDTHDGFIFPSTQVDIEMHDISKSDSYIKTLLTSRVWPYTSYTMAWLRPDLGLQQTSIGLKDNNLQSDYNRFIISGDALPPTIKIHPYLFNNLYGWHRKSGKFARTNQNILSNITVSWEPWEGKADKLYSKSTRISAYDSQTKQASHCVVQGVVDVAIPIGKNLVCVQMGQILAMWNWRINRIISISDQYIEQVINLQRHTSYGAPWSEVQQQLTVAVDGQRAFLRSADGTLKLFNLRESGQISFEGTIFPRLNSQPLFLTKDYFYSSRENWSSSIHFSDGHKTYPFEQFDLRLNRPDIVLERLGAPDEAIAIAKQLREKRLKRMGVTEDMLQPDFHLPEIEIVGDIPSSTVESELVLKIKASDSKYPLDRLRLYVNNVPVNGKEGELLRDSKSQFLERTIPIKLAAGRNKIQVSVLNSAGAESLYANAEVTCTAPRPKPALYAVAMGVSEYANPEWNLKYAAKDARDILERVKARSGSSYGEIKELLLTDREVTKESLGKIRDFLSKATVDDTVLLFVAGHGLLDSKYDYYFGTTDIDFDNPSANGIAIEEFDDLLAELPCLRKSLLIDTCHAGELDEDEKKMLASAQANSNQVVAMLPTGARGMTIKPIEGARGKSEWYDRLQGLFVGPPSRQRVHDPEFRAGAEYALESSEQKNGLFTYAVLEALDGKEGSDANKDGSVTMSELANYVKTRVATLTNNKQSPNVRRVNLEGDFALSKK